MQFMEFDPGHLNLSVTDPDGPATFKTERYPWNGTYLAVLYITEGKNLLCRMKCSLFCVICLLIQLRTKIREVTGQSESIFKEGTVSEIRDCQNRDCKTGVAFLLNGCGGAVVTTHESVRTCSITPTPPPNLIKLDHYLALHL